MVRIKNKNKDKLSSLINTLDSVSTGIYDRTDEKDIYETVCRGFSIDDEEYAGIIRYDRELKKAEIICTSLPIPKENNNGDSVFSVGLADVPFLEKLIESEETRKIESEKTLRTFFGKVIFENKLRDITNEKKYLIISPLYEERVIRGHLFIIAETAEDTVVQLVKHLSRHVSKALQVTKKINSQIVTEKQLKYLSFHDKLTGLYNRAYFEVELGRLDTPRQLPLSVIMGDIDGLKLVNDAFGYRRGDDLLKNISRILKESCRADDIIARWGGDEFVILLPKTNRKDAGEIIDRVRLACQDNELQELPLNISLGYAVKEKKETSILKIISKAENMMKHKKVVEGNVVSNSIISSLEKKLWGKSTENIEHVERTRKLCMSLARAAHVSRMEQGKIPLLASLHDIGKIAIKNSILLNKDSLDEGDWAIMKRHPEIGYRITKSSAQLAHIAEDVLSHHENWDGSGYPRNLSGSEIPVLSRIIAIVDAYDVMVNGRIYKKAISREQAIQELKKCSGRQFDPYLVNKFVDILEGRNDAPSLF